MVKIVSVVSDNPLPGYPANANYAIGFQYAADAQLPNGPPVPFRADSMLVTPDPKIRWPYPWVVEAFKIGQILPAVMMDGKLYITMREERWAAPCGWMPDTSGSNPPPGGGAITPGPANPPITIGPGGGIAPVREPFPRIFPDPVGPIPIGGQP